MSNIPNAPSMSDSNDFTFLPPLDKQIQQPSLVNTYSRQNSLSRNSGKNISAQQLHYSCESAGSTNSLGTDSVIRQVQVHSSTKTNARAVPVPSQRITFAKMEERRNTNSKYGGNVSNHNLGAFNGIERISSIISTNTLNKGQTGRIPSVEDLNLPESKIFCLKIKKHIYFLAKFVINSMKTLNYSNSERTRRNTFNDLAQNAINNGDSVLNITAQNSLNIPKSATCLTLPVAKDSSGSRILPLAERQVDNIRYLSTSPNAQSNSASAHVKIVTNNSSLTSPSKIKITPMDLKDSAR